MPTLLIVNPNSFSGRTGRNWPSMERRLMPVCPVYEVEFTSGPDEAAEIARRALRQGFNRLIAVGGDGTINEVVNGFFENGVAVNPQARLGLIPSGTGGDFRRSFGLARDLASAIEVLKRDRVRKIDLGRLNFVGNDGESMTRYFSNIASFGMSGEIMLKVNRGSRLKRLNGSLAFFWATVRTMLRWKNVSVRLTICGENGYSGEFPMNTIHICNGRYSGGGMLFAPDASVDDGLFDVIVMGDFKLHHLLNSARLLYSGAHVNHPLVRVLSGRRVEVESDEELILEVDGETPGRLPASFEVIPRTLSLIC